MLLGLEALVAGNPSNTSGFIREWVERHGGTLDPHTRMFQMLCEMAVAYRNHHHKTELVELLERAGGRLTLLRSAENIGSMRVM